MEVPPTEDNHVVRLQDIAPNWANSVSLVSLENNVNTGFFPTPADSTGTYGTTIVSPGFGQLVVQVCQTNSQTFTCSLLIDDSFPIELGLAEGQWQSISIPVTTGDKIQFLAAPWSNGFSIDWHSASRVDFIPYKGATS